MSSLSALGLTNSTTTTSTTRTSIGLASGLNTDEIISGLLAGEQAKIARIDAQKERTLQVQTAFKTIEARLRTLQGNMTSLSRSQNSIFEARAVKMSDSDLATAAASSSAVPGVTEFTIHNLARAQQVASQGFDRATSEITQGTITLQSGSNAAVTITVDGANNSLQGLATAINAANAGVTASVINDGGGDDQQAYRLVLTAQKTGVANSIKITNNLAASSGSATKINLASNAIGAVSTGGSYSGTSVVQSNSDTGSYTGTSNNEYQFTVVNGGTVGTDNNIQIAYTDSTGSNTGTLTIDSGDVGILKNVAQGIGIQLSAGTLVAGDTFKVKAFVPNVQDAKDATISLGSGPGALTVTNATNTFENLVPGVTIEAKAADPTKSITLTVSADTEKVKKAITDFVNSYNDVLKNIDELTAYNPTSKSAGLLLGNRFATTIQDQVRSAVAGIVEGVAPVMNRISALGISTDNSGRLVIDDAKLSDTLAGKREGITLADVRRLFVLSGVSGHGQVQFVTGSTKTKASSTPYTVHISQAAEQASLTATTDLAASTVVDSSNNAFTITVDGKASSTITLGLGTYTRQALTQAVQSAINSNADLTGRTVTAKLDGNRLVLTSNAYGSASTITVGTGTALTALGLTTAATASGKDVVGNFVVDGQVESAIGNGQFLVGSSTNARTADLQLRVSLTPTQVGAGLDTTVSVSRGIASKLDTTLNALFDPVVGRLKTLNDGFDETIKRFEETKTRQNTFIDLRRQTLLKQFIAMEQTLARLQATGNQLTAQMNSINSSK